MTPNEIHKKRAFHNPTWKETAETLAVERDYQAEARCRDYLRARTAAYRAGKEVEFLKANPEDRSSEFRG
jgi:hypothetical protein